MELYHAAASIHAARRAVARFSFEIRVALPAPDALVLFTPEGERAWDPQWNPTYASPTVFTTDEHSSPRVWLIDAYDSKAGTIAYTVFAAGKSVTRIAVSVRASAAGAVARVCYDRTAIAASADADVAAFAKHGDEMREEWQRAIDAAVRAR